MLEIGSVIVVLLIFGYLVYTKRSIKEAQQDMLEIIAGLHEALKATAKLAEETKKVIDEQKQSKDDKETLH